MKKDLQETHRWRGRNWISLLPSPFLQMLVLLGVFWGSGLAKLYIVPGHFQTLFQAFQAAHSGDTVVIRPQNPQEPLPQPGIYLFQNKTISLGIWPVRSPNPRNASFSDQPVSLPYSLSSPAPDTSWQWTTQQRLTGPDTLVDIMAHPFYDPVRNWFWVPWHRGPAGGWSYVDDVAMWYDFSTGEWSRMFSVTGKILRASSHRPSEGMGGGVHKGLDRSQVQGLSLGHGLAGG